MTDHFTTRSVRFAARAAMTAGLVVALGACSGGLFKSKPKTTPTVGTRVPILSKIVNGEQVDPSLQGVTVVVPPPQANEAWAQAGGTANKAYGHLALSDNPAPAWTASIAGTSNRRRLAAAPVVGNGKLFAVDTDAMVRAFDADSGRELWHFQMSFDGKNANSAFGGGASYDNGKLYATNGVGEVVALDAATGEKIWQVKPAGPLRGAPTLAYDTVYVMTQDNQIFALKAADGSLEWQEAGSIGQAGVFGVAAPAAGQSTVIAGYSTGELVAYRYENGRQLWSDALARTSISTQVGSLTDIDADPIIDNGRVFALGQGGRMASYELVTGQRIWELNLAGISTPAIAGEWIFTLTDDARLLAIARSTGKIRWITQMQQWRKEKKKTDPIFWTGPVLAGNNLWIASSDGQVYRVSVGEGSASLFTDLKAGVSLPPVVANNTLYILDDSGKIHAFR
ncbi:MAG: PQQ-binding-like beta-propeller repeat protein [Sphingomonadales bacterium]|nr:PQQ-binding-like beta-propeller repeat protein [Sphingomonadales bacterium]MBD3774944.1 PQQ-binding-like beta-propeller repeat protein [Paracoccaceae bacterium]